MKLRFFLIILTVVGAVSAAMIYMHSRYLKQARVYLIDEQLRETATALIDSGFGQLSKSDLRKSADAIISDELGESRIGKFFVVRDARGDIVFESGTLKLLDLGDIPQNERWLTVQDEEQYVRVLNLDLPQIPDRFLQVGVVMAHNLLEPGYFSRFSFAFFAGAVGLGLLVAWFLSAILLRPIRDLENFITLAAAQVSHAREVPAIPLSLKRQPLFLTKDGDEFDRLLAGLDVLIERVNRGYKLTRLWTYHLAHELKTPLAVLAVSLHESNLCDADKTLRRIDDTIATFLEWAAAEGPSSRTKIHANRAGQVVTDVVIELSGVSGNRVKVWVGQDFYILSEQQHLRQAISNLISNALLYSTTKIFVSIDSYRIEVRDRGPGVPAVVFERLGEPFNRSGGGRQSHGLGLAWVISIARINGWIFELKNLKEGTMASVVFPHETETS